MKKSVSFFRYVHDSLSPYRLVTSLVVSALVSLLFAGVSLKNRVNSDQQIVQAVAPYLATLVESQDRPELLRVIESISETTGAEVLLNQDGQVLASSRDLSEMDRPFSHPSVRRVIGMDLTDERIFSRFVVRRDAGPDTSAEVLLFTPLWAPVGRAAGLGLATFILAVAVSIFSSVQLKGAIRQALRPLEQLHQDIRCLGTAKLPESSPIVIAELEEIRATIFQTQTDLASARDRLAEERAKKLSAESYKRLIHDLHNPVAALRQNVRLLMDPLLDEEAKQEATESVPRIADQILKQVISAKRNLEHQPESLLEADIRLCVERSLQQLRSALEDYPDRSLSLVQPEVPVLAPHDPDLLQRAIINLVENGIHACRKQVQVSIQYCDSGVSIIISDDGPGMDESQVSLHLQGRGQSSKRDRQAFGLSSANHIVRAHGGRIIYRPGVMGGASFEIRLGAA